MDTRQLPRDPSCAAETGLQVLCETIVQAPAPSRPIARGIAGPALLAHVQVAKFVDHLPLYRQSVIYVREGVELERALLANWVGAASALCVHWWTHKAPCARWYPAARRRHADSGAGAG